jgi:glucose uptake protein GlcU
MAKQQRMFVVTLGCLFCACVPQAWQQWQPGTVALIVIITGTALTACRRAAHIAKTLKGRHP